LPIAICQLSILIWLEQLLTGSRKLYQRSNTLTFLIAPDKFKGSLSARQVCDAVQQALQEHDPSFSIITLPLADGGEGSCELLTSFSSGTMIAVPVHDPLFRKIDSQYGLSKDGSVAFIEMAGASGYQLLTPEERNPLLTTTYGTGEQIVHALEKGVKEVVLGIGGSATNDGGMGLAQALGVSCYDAAGKLLKPVGENLRLIRSIDATGMHPRMRDVAFTILCDVDNPLHGPRGAAHVFGPQKGATPEMISVLEEGLKQLEKILEGTFQTVVNFPGAGAGGGLPAMIKALARVSIRPGMEFMIQYTGLEELVRKADVIITGEGRIDAQTLSGKVVKGVATVCVRHHKPVYVVAALNTLEEVEASRLGIRKVVTIMNAETSAEQSLKNAFPLLKQRVREELIPFFL
jgi:glycerate 2-kinase